MYRWLRAQGSLTARLKALGPVQVQVMAQGTRRLWPAERQALGEVAGHVREVVLVLDGLPVVWARSVTSTRALKGPWRALKGLGSRPLAELLFSHAHVRRGPLALHAWRPQGAEHGRARRDWQLLLGALASGNTAGSARPPGWARQSLFWHHGQPLRVLEAFSPRAGDLRTPR